MERPWKRMRISDPEIRSPRDPGSQLAEGLFTSEMGIRSDDSDKHQPQPTRTINLPDLQRRTIVVEHRLARPPLQRRNAEHQFVPRAPAVTVTSKVIQINVGDATKTSAAATIPAVSSDTVVSLTSLGAVTVAGGSGTNVVGSTGSGSQSLITTPPPTPLPSGSTLASGSVGPTGLISSSVNSTLSDSSSDSTVTVTSTSTLDFAYLNGTFVTTSFSGRPTDSLSGSDLSSLYTSTLGPSGIGGSSDSSDSSATSYFGAGGPFATDATATAPGVAASSSSASAHGGGGGGPGLSPAQQTVVGGVVGGVAGLALVLLLLLAFLRWYRRRLKARGELPEPLERHALAGSSHHHTMSQRSSGVPLASAFAASLRKFRPVSSHTQGTTATASTMPESEKGFQRIAGRKIASVLGSGGGDGFGGSYGAFEKESGAPGQSSHTRNERSLAGSSFYRDSGGFYGGRGNDVPSSPTTATNGTGSRAGHGPGITRDFADDELHPHPSQISLPSSKPEGMAALRPSPARTPVTISPAASSIRLPIQQTPAMDDAPPLPLMSVGLAVPMSRDGIGRSLPSQDGSRVSRSSGRSRFAEQI